MGTFTYYETEIGENSTDFISFVRFQVDDTNSSAYDLSDEVITALYNDTSTEDAQITRNYYTAIKAAEYLYRKATKNVDSFSSGGTSVNYANRASRLLDLIAQLRTKLLSINNISTVVYASRPSYYSEV